MALALNNPEKLPLNKEINQLYTLLIFFYAKLIFFKANDTKILLLYNQNGY